MLHCATVELCLLTIDRSEKSSSGELTFSDAEAREAHFSMLTQPEGQQGKSAGTRTGYRVQGKV